MNPNHNTRLNVITGASIQAPSLLECCRWPVMEWNSIGNGTATINLDLPHSLLICILSKLDIHTDKQFTKRFQLRLMDIVFSWRRTEENYSLFQWTKKMQYKRWKAFKQGLKFQWFVYISEAAKEELISAAWSRQWPRKMLVMAFCSHVSSGSHSRPCRHYVTDDCYVISDTPSISCAAVQPVSALWPIWRLIKLIPSRTVAPLPRRLNIKRISSAPSQSLLALSPPTTFLSLSSHGNLRQHSSLILMTWTLHAAAMATAIMHLRVTLKFIIASLHNIYVFNWFPMKCLHVSTFPQFIFLHVFKDWSWPLDTNYLATI